MVTEMSSVRLKSGETMQIVRVTAPDAQWKQPVMDFLQHKGEPWLGGLHVIFDRSLEGLGAYFYLLHVIVDQSLEGLGAYFYLGLLDGEIVGNIMSTEAAQEKVGILGHVFTHPDHRRKGICAAIMEVLTGDFVARGGRGMTLGTGYGSPAYHIYYRSGFRPVRETGYMIWEAEASFLASYFSPGATTVRDVRWADWALLDLLYKTESSNFLRGGYHGHYGLASYEGCFLRFYRLLQEESGQSKVLAKSGGEVVGHTLLLPDPRWNGNVLLLDLFIHPDFCDAGAELLAAIVLPPGRKVQAYADSQSPEKVELLKRRGFQQEAVLHGQLVNAENEPLDVVILSAVG